MHPQVISVLPPRRLPRVPAQQQATSQSASCTKIMAVLGVLGLFMYGWISYSFHHRSSVTWEMLEEELAHPFKHHSGSGSGAASHGQGKAGGVAPSTTTASTGGQQQQQSVGAVLSRKGGDSSTHAAAIAATKVVAATTAASSSGAGTSASSSKAGRAQLPSMNVPAGQPWLDWNGSKLPLLVTDSNVKDVLQRHVLPSQNAVAFNTFRGGIKPSEMDFIRNLFVQAGKVGLGDSLLVLCTTRITCLSAWRQGVPLFLSNLTSNGTPASPDPTITKWLVAAFIVKAGFNALFLDFDLGFHCDVFPKFDPAADMDILWDKAVNDASGEGMCTNGFMYRTAGKDLSSMCACTGFWYMRGRPYMEAFSHYIYRQSLSTWEQTLFNRVAPLWDIKTSTANPTPDEAADKAVQHLKINVLSYPTFVNIINLPHLRNGKKVQSDYSDVCMRHAGIYAGGQKKRDEMKAVDAFAPDKFPDVVKGRTVQLAGYGAGEVLPVWDPKRSDMETIWV